MRLNCQRPKDADPCGKCNSCRKYLTDPPSHPCHHEVNASDKRKIDDVRAMIAQSHYKPIGGTWAVFLIDEPQGMIPQAQEAILKPLEDPPKHVVWIFCTTDPGRLKEAIKSRCAAGHLSIRPAKTALLVKRLSVICKKEGYEGIPDDALTKIVEAADNHARDSIGTLEKLINAIEDVKAEKSKGKKTKVKLSAILPRVLKEVQGGKPSTFALKAVLGIIGDDLTSALEATNNGLPAEVFLRELMRHWEQVVLSSANIKLISPWFGYTMRKDREARKVFGDMERDALPSLVRGAEYLTKQYERAKTYVVDGRWLVVMTVTTLHQICSPIHDEDDE